MDLSHDELDILISCVSSKMRKFDETWADAGWRREQRVKTDTDFYRKQAAARELAGDLLARLKSEQAV